MATMTRWMSGGLAVAVAALFAASGGHVAAAQAGPTFVVPSQTVDISAGTVTVPVQVQDPFNVGAFGFTLRYDPGVLTPQSSQATGFLASSGRPIWCLAAIVDAPSSGAGTFRWSCATVGVASQGASASGLTTIATVTFRLAGGASTAINIEKATLGDTGGLPMCVADPASPTRVDSDYLNTCPTQNGSIIVTGGNPALDRGLQPTPTPTLAPIAVATSVPIGGAPVSGATPAPGGVASTGDSSTSNGAAAPGGAANPGSGSGAGPAGGAPSGTIAGASSGALSGGAGAGTGAPGSGGRTVGSYGFGPPPPSHQQARRDAIIAALTLAALGFALLRAAAAVRPRM